MRLRVPLALTAAIALLAQDFPLTRGWEYRNRQTLAWPVAAATADFNGDGLMDLAIASSGASTLLVHLAAGEPMTWREPAAYDTGAWPTSVVVGDFNGDGISDLAAGASTGLSILIGKGDGGFTASPVYSRGAPVTELVAGDFNGDGLTDLAAVLAGTLTISLSFGRGFDTSWTRPITGEVSGLLAADLTNDSRLDLALVQDATVLVWPGRGDGALTEPSRIGSRVDGFCAADLNNDKVLDLVTGGFEASFDPATPVKFHAGQPGGGFEAPAPVHNQGGRVVCGDFSGDGISDAVVYSVPLVPGLERSDFTLIPGGTMKAQPLGLELQAFPDVVVAARFDGDARVDLAVLDYQADRVVCVRSPRDGQFESRVLSNPERLVAIAAADFNRDGRMDSAVINGSKQEVWVFQSAPDGSYVRVFAQPVTGRNLGIAAGDFDADGNSDVAVTSTGGAQLLWGDGRGGFSAPMATPLTATALPASQATDLNGDRVDDLVVPFTARGTGHVQVLPGNRTRGLSQPKESEVGRLFGPFVFADLNRDGKKDIVAPTVDALNAAMGKGDGTFQTHWSFEIGPHPGPAVAVGDFDGDGQPDAVAGNVNGLWFFRGLPDGSFAGRVAVPAIQAPCDDCAARQLHAGDFDRDGRLDVVVVTPSAVVFLRGAGDGTFRAPVSLPVSQEVLSGVLADFDGDGIADLALTHPGGITTYVSAKERTSRPGSRAGRPL